MIEARGGVAGNDDIRNDVAKWFGLDDEQLSVPHDPSRGRRTEFEYRLAWARTHLSNAGAIVRAGPKSWALTELGRRTLNNEPLANTDAEAPGNDGAPRGS